MPFVGVKPACPVVQTPYLDTFHSHNGSDDILAPPIRKGHNEQQTIFVHFVVPLLNRINEPS